MSKDVLKWIGFGGLLAAGLVTLLTLWLFQVFSMPKRVISYGERDFWQTHLVQAEDNYQRALDIAKTPFQRSAAYTQLCRLYRYQEKYAQSLSSCQAAVQANPENVEAVAQLARTYSWMGNYEEAVKQGQKALQMDERNPVAASFLAEAIANEVAAQNQEGAADFTQANNVAQFALDLDRENAESYQVLGYIWQLQGDFDEAAIQYQRALQIRPDFFAFYIDFGDVESKRMNLESALTAYDTALELNPESVLALQGRGWAWWSSGEYDQAKNDFQQAIQLNAQNAESWTGLGWAYLNQDSREQALHAFNQALDLDPENVQAQRGAENIQVEQVVLNDVDVDIDGNQQESEGSFTEVIKQAIGGTVQIYTYDNSFQIHSVCSGALISLDGHILTNGHCVANPDTQQPFNDQKLAGIGVVTDPKQPPERLYRANVVEVDFTLDIALLKIFGDWDGNVLENWPVLSPLPLGDSDDLLVGEEVWSIGFPGMGGDTLTLTKGVISGFAELNGTPWIKTDLMTGPGNSGGVVVNTKGELVGIHSQSWSDQGQASSRLSVERPINATRAIWENYVSSENTQAFDQNLEVAAIDSAPRVSLESQQLNEQDEVWSLDDAFNSAVQVYILDESQNIVTTCSGVIISPDGYMLTYTACLRPEDVAMENGLIGIGMVRDDPGQLPERLYRAEPVVIDEAWDVSLIRVTSDWLGNPVSQESLNLPAIRFAETASIEIGQPIWSVGYPEMGAGTLTITGGIVSGFVAGEHNISRVKTDLLMGAGNQGGMILNDKGELLAVHCQNPLENEEEQVFQPSLECPIMGMKHLWQPVVAQ